MEKKSPLEQLSIENETFIKSLSKRTRKLYFTKSGKIRKKLNSKDLYQRSILENCLRLHSTINTLSLSRLFIEERGSVFDDSNNKINNGDYIRYHIECFFIRVTTYKDLVYKLVNKTYDLKINENIGLERKIRNYCKKQNDKEIKTILEGLDILMNKIIPIRNEIAHGDYYDDIDLIIIESHHLTKRDNEENEIYKESLKRLLINNEIKMYSIELMMCAYLSLIYKILLPIRRKIEKEKLLTKRKKT